MTGLERRLTRLEACPGNGGAPPTIFVSFVSPDGTTRPVQSATTDFGLYQRATAEAEDAFRDRVKADIDEAPGTPSGTRVRVVFLA